MIDFRALALDTYRRTVEGNPHLPIPNTPAGQRRVEELEESLRLALARRGLAARVLAGCRGGLRFLARTKPPPGLKSLDSRAGQC